MHRSWLFSGVVALCAWACGPAAWADAPPASSLSAVVERVMPAVVSISVAMRSGGLVETGDPDLDQLLKRFLEQNGKSGPQAGSGRGQEVTALGSGFIVDPAGLIVTNNHLVAQADRITVILQDQRRRPARIIGRDPMTDIALLKIDTGDAGLPYVRWADSDRAKVGDWVFAAGNPFGLGGTVTAGIISARDRNIDDDPYDDFLQIDAPINRGNSGGPTFNLAGEVLGINTAIFSPSGGSIGIGFAIPATFARGVVEQLRATGHVVHGWIGVTLQSVTPELARSFGIDPDRPAGAVIDEVVSDGPAAQAGLRQGDVILALSGKKLNVARDLPRLIGGMPAGSQVMVSYRRDGKDQSVPAIVGAMPATASAAAEPTEGSGSSEPPRDPLGAELQALTPDLRQRLALPKSVDGVAVAEIAPSGAAASLGLKPGDVIVAIDRRKVTTPQDAAKRFATAMATGQVLVLINRRGSAQFLGAALDRRISAMP